MGYFEVILGLEKPKKPVFRSKKNFLVIFWSFLGGFGSFFGQKPDFWPKIDHFELPIPVFWPKNGHFFDFFDQKVVGNFLGEFWGGFGVILGSKNGIFGPKLAILSFRYLFLVQKMAIFSIF